MVDHSMEINIPSGLPGIRNMGFAKLPRVPSNPVLPYVTVFWAADIIYNTIQYNTIQFIRHLHIMGFMVTTSNIQSIGQQQLKTS